MKNKAQQTADIIARNSDDIYNKCEYIVDAVCNEMVKRCEYSIALRESFFNAFIMRDNLNVTVDDILHCVMQEGFSIKPMGFEYIISIPPNPKRN